MSLVVHEIEEWLDENYPLSGEEDEVPSCITLVERVLDTLDRINQEQRCSICLLPLLAAEGTQNERVLATRTTCGHVYDFDCLSTWWVQHEEAVRAAHETVSSLLLLLLPSI